MILGLVRNYIPSNKWCIEKKGWNIADCVQRAYDVEGMTVGTVAAGRIGLAVLRRMKPFDCKLAYCDRHQLPSALRNHASLQRRDDRKNEARRIPCEHCSGKDLRQRCNCARIGKRTASRLRW